MRALLAISLLAACLVCSFATAVPAHAAPGMEVGLQDDSVFVYRTYYDREKALQQARRLGVTRLRVNLSWVRTLADPTSKTKPSPLVYNWSQYDDAIAAAARYGIAVQLTLAGAAPAWATVGHHEGFRQVSPAAFGAFAAAAAEHFRGRVTRYSIWNEPNWHTLLEPSADCRKGSWGKSCEAKAGSLYRRLYIAGYTQIKHADPSAQVLIGELAPRAEGRAASPPLSFLRAVTCSQPNWKAAHYCGHLYADGFAQHPYDFQVKPTTKPRGPDDVTMATLGRLTTALDKLAARHALTTPTGHRLDVYLTEYGYFSEGARRIPESTRAAYLRESFDIALHNPRVRQLLQYLLVASPEGLGSFPTQIVKASGQPSKSFTALANWAGQNAGRIAGPLTPPQIAPILGPIISPIASPVTAAAPAS
jgi:hypothetical protein